MTGIERLRTLVDGTKNTSLLKVIDYLETRKDMYERYMNEEKTPEQMWKYITKKAKNQAINDCAVIDERVVYVWALSYFLATNESLGLTKKETAVSVKKQENKNDSKTDNVIDIEKAKEIAQISMFKEG